jgi:hypothetical protein
LMCATPYGMFFLTLRREPAFPRLPRFGCGMAG